MDILTGLARNPNASGVLFVGLGGENPLISDLYNRALAEDCHAMFSIMRKNSGDMILHLLDDLASTSPRVREEFPVSSLCVGLLTGDGYAGASANPLLGRFAENLSSQGGTALTPLRHEMFRIPHDIIRRITRKNSYDAFEAICQSASSLISASSPDDWENGITTENEKSASSLSLIGEAQVSNVLGYGTSASDENGVQIAPGSLDSASSCTSLVGGGAQIILYATGRGTPFGTVIPTVKIAASTDLAEHRPGWTDFDAGPILDGEPWEAADERLWKYVLEVACGRLVAHETKGFGDIALLK
jgi:altronate hydrolase